MMQKESHDTLLLILEHELHQNICLYQAREQEAKPTWRIATCQSTQDQVRNMYCIIWSLGKHNHMILTSEMCIQMTMGWNGRMRRMYIQKDQNGQHTYFYEGDHWHPPLSHLQDIEDPDSIAGARGRTCLYRKAYDLGLCPPVYYRRISNMSAWRLNYSRMQQMAPYRNIGKGRGKGESREGFHDSDDGEDSVVVEQDVDLIDDLERWHHTGVDTLRKRKHPA